MLQCDDAPTLITNITNFYCTMCNWSESRIKEIRQYFFSLPWFILWRIKRHFSTTQTHLLLTSCSHIRAQFMPQAKLNESGWKCKDLLYWQVILHDVDPYFLVFFSFPSSRSLSLSHFSLSPPLSSPLYLSVSFFLSFSFGFIRSHIPE